MSTSVFTFLLQPTTCFSFFSPGFIILFFSRLRVVHPDWNTPRWRHHRPPVKCCQLSGALLWEQSTYENWLLLSTLSTEQDSLVCLAPPPICAQRRLRSLFIIYISRALWQQTFSLAQMYFCEAGEVYKQSHAKLPHPCFRCILKVQLQPFFWHCCFLMACLH